MKVKDLTDRYEELGLTGEEMVVQKYNWEPRPDSTEDHPLTYVEEWEVTSQEGEFKGCIYDDGNGYDFAPGYECGHLDY